MAKRTRIKGKGAAIFLGDTDQKPPQKKDTPPPSKKKQAVGKATYYLPQDLLNELEDTWLSLRKKYKDRKVAKSEIVRIALDALITDWKDRAEKSTLTRQLGR